MDWKIYYGDGTTFSSDEGSPEKAPGYNVACIVVPHPDVGRRILQKADFYIWDRGQWFDSEWFGTMKRVIDVPGVRVLAGEYLHDNVWKAVNERAINDPDFPPKAGYAPDEKV